MPIVSGPYIAYPGQRWEKSERIHQHWYLVVADMKVLPVGLVQGEPVHVKGERRGKEQKE